MRYLALIALLSIISRADVIIGPSVKYGVNGYNSSGTSNSSETSLTSGKGKNSSTVTSTQNSNNISVSNRTEAVMGFKFQTVPDVGSLSVGAGAYCDGTVELNFGIRL